MNRGSVDPIYRPDGTIAWRARGPRPERKSLGIYATPEEAERVLLGVVEILHAAGRGLTLAVWGVRWLDARERGGLHRATKKDRNRWRVHVATADFASWPLKRITARDVRVWVRALMKKEAQHGGEGLGRPISRRTVVGAYNLLRRALADAVEDGKLGTNPAKEVAVPKVATDKDGWTYLTVAEIAALLAAPRPPRAKPEHRAAIALAIYTGLRPGELWGLRWGDVTLDGERPELHVCRNRRLPTKGGRPRYVPLLPAAVEVLKAWKRERSGIGGALVFPRSDGGCHGEGYDAAWRSWRAAAGIERGVVFYDCRHTCATHLLMGTWAPRLRLEDVSAWLGHQDLKTTQRYARVAPGSLYDAIRGPKLTQRHSALHEVTT